jgi:hypothetical protein
MPAPTKNPLLATIAPATKLENCGAMIRNVPTQVRSQPAAVTALRQSGVHALWTLRI